MSPHDLSQSIKFIAQQVGFDDCRISEAGPALHGERLLEWIDEGCAGDMAWMERDPHRRIDPREVLPGARSVISFALNYFPGDHVEGSSYKIARYAWNEDYHDVVESKLKDFNESLISLGGTQRFYVDTGPVLERDFASASGLGWNGKSTVQIHRKLGTWFFLCEMITTLDIAQDTALSDHCGKCTRCIDACPTNAITGPRTMDARRCISYLTIEHSGSIPLELRSAIGDRIYGCDDCLEVCPWNRFAKISRETKFLHRPSIFKNKLTDFLNFDESTFQLTFARSPIKRIKWRRFMRNACVVAGNSADIKYLPQLESLSTHEDPLIAEHAEWAAKEILDQTKSTESNSS